VSWRGWGDRVIAINRAHGTTDPYRNGYATVPEARQGLERYFAFYNQERLHHALGYRTPAALYLGD
jgi:transposase InsO family protein